MRSLLLTLAVTCLALASPAFAQQPPPSPDGDEPRESVEITFTRRDWIKIGIGSALFAVVAAAGIVYVYRRSSTMLEQYEQADARFEQMVLTSAVQPLVPQPIPPPSAPTPALLVQADNTPHPRILDAIERLRIAGLACGPPSFRELHGNPQGLAIISLPSGQTAAIVADFESASFVVDHLRRHAFVVFAHGAGPPVIIQTVASAAARQRAS